jgi:hypothetical protein
MAEAWTERAGRAQREYLGKSVTRRKALLGISSKIGGLIAASQIGASVGTSTSSHADILANPKMRHYEVLEVGPGKRFPSLTLAGCFMNSISRWNGGYTDPALIAQMAFRIIISPGPPGYYTNDSGSHSRKWSSLVGWPPYEGALLGPVIIEGEANKPAPVLDTDGYGDGVLYYQTGLFETRSCDATFRRLIFRGFRRQDGYGNYAAVRLGPRDPNISTTSHVLFEDCEISDCVDGIMGGTAGQSLTLRRCYIHDNGNYTGLVHNVYFGGGDLLTVEDCLSTRCSIGHLLKSRAARTHVRNSRLLGNGGMESACLDVPDAGVLELDHVVCEKSPGTDAGWTIHYSGENQDAGGGPPFHVPSSINIRDLTMIAPPAMVRHPGGAILGFANQSGLGAASSGEGSHLIRPHAQDVKVFGLTAETAGLPYTVLPYEPALDLSSPIRVAG